MAMRSRNPMELCIFAVLAASSSKTALHLAPLPGSMSPSGGFGRFAAITLFAGCLLGIVGIAWRNRSDGVVMEQFGCALAGFGCLFYAGALVGLGQYPQTAFGIGMACGIAVFCWFRYFQIDRWIRRHRRLNRGKGGSDAE